MSVRRWLLVLGVVAVMTGQAGVSGAAVLPGLAVSPTSPILINSPVVISNLPGGECGAERPPQSSALAALTPPTGDQILIFSITLADGNWSITFVPDQVGHYEVSVACLTSVPPDARPSAIPPGIPPEVIDFTYQDTSFDVVASLPTTVTTIDSTTTTTTTTPASASSARPVITTAPTFTG